MDRYHIALFVHLVALVTAASAAAVTKLAAARRMRARTVGEMLEWHDVLGSAARLFPACLATLLVTGAYMLRLAATPTWSAPFVVAGLAGAAFLLASSTYLAVQGAALKRSLETFPLDAPPPRFVPPPLVMLLPAVNGGVALAVVFVMATKPASHAAALGALVIGIALSALRTRRASTAARASGLTHG